MASARNEHRCETTQQPHICDDWLKPRKPTSSKANTDTDELAPQSSAIDIRLIATLIILGLSLLLIVSAGAYKNIHDYLHTNDIKQLHESNLYLINTLKPLSSTLENIRLLTAANSDHNQAFSIFNTELGQLIAPTTGLAQATPKNTVNDQLDQQLLDEVIARGNTYEPLLNGYFQQHDREYLWAANTVPGTPYTLVHRSHHKHASLIRFLQNTNTLTAIIIITGGLLALLWVSAAPSRLHKFKLHRALARQAAEEETQQGYIKAEKQLLSDDLRDAIINNQLELYYQAKLDLKHNTINAVEALARWTHPRYGFIPPDVFIQIAERYGLIRKFTEWVLQTAIEQCAQWNQVGNNIGIAINLSSHNLHDDNLVEHLSNLLQRWQVAPGQISLEISEAVILHDPAQAINFCSRINQLGVRLSIDNFSAQHSSLSHLKQLPVREIKIDKSFILGIKGNKNLASSVRNTISLAHKHGFSVVAEGVEEQASLEQLQQMGCGSAQGYYICRPMPGRDLLPMVNACHTGNDSMMNSAEITWGSHST